jgi:serine protease Do
MRSHREIGIALLVGAALTAPAGMSQKAPHPPQAAEVVSQREGSYLGIGVQEVDSERAKALKLSEERGAEITRVDPDTPAFKAGVKPGDVLLEYNGTAVQGTDQLQRMVRDTPPGKTVKLVVWRNGASLSLSATVRKGLWVETPGGEINVVMAQPMPPAPPMPPMAMPRIITIMPSGMLGIDGEPLNQEPQFAEFMGVKDGVLVKAVNHNSAAERAGIKAGDVIVKIDDTHVSNSSDITSALRASRSKRNFNLTIVRSKKEMPVPVTLDER